MRLTPLDSIPLFLSLSRMNNNRTDEAAVLGVFSKTSYITFGENEKPLSYVQKVRAGTMP